MQLLTTDAEGVNGLSGSDTGSCVSEDAEINTGSRLRAVAKVEDPS